MISKEMRILALASFSCLALLSFGMAQQPASISISTVGTITKYLSYICGNYNSTHYYARNNVTGNYELISTDAAKTISYALSKLTPGRTWPETVLLRGSFSIYTTITLSVGNVLLDFSQATVTPTASVTAFKVSAGSNNSTFYGGQYDPFTNTRTHSHWIGSSGSTAIQTCATKTVVDGFEFSGFTGISSILYASSGSSTLTVQNCYFHDNAATTGNTNINLLSTSGYHNVINCKFDIGFTGIMINPGVTHVRITNSEFLGWKTSGGHAIYSDGGSNTGYNEIAFCKFHDGVNGAGCHIKSQNNSIHDNTFYNLTNTGAVGISLYSELSGYTANDNDIYRNTFTNCYYGMWLGHNPANNPTLRNKIHDNTFNRVTDCIMLNPWSGAINTVEDTKIYYNDFYSCANPFPISQSSASLIKNTVIAYNYFDASVPSGSVNALQSYVNTMSYQNTFYPPNTSLAMANYNPSSIMDPNSWYYVAPRA